MKHVLFSGQFSTDDLDYIFKAADKHAGIKPQILSEKEVMDIVYTGNVQEIVEDYPNLCNKIMATLFFEPSTRTRLSFESAMIRLGGKIITENLQSSSFNKGETLSDTIKTVSQYADIIVLRHPEIGSANEAAKHSDVPIINAGDGAGQHPTQALLDAYTILKEKGTLEGLRIVIEGDYTNSRTAHSLVNLLLEYKSTIWINSPEGFFEEIGRLERMNTTREELLKNADVVYVIRPQKERWSHVAGYDASNWIFNKECLDLLKSDAIVMHALPRNEELPKYIDNDPRCVIWKQVKYGMYVRMGLLQWIFD